MSYRPITDIWVLARAKLKGGEKYYGAYPGGFPERARALLGATIDEPVLHVCGGMVRNYPYHGGFGLHDKTLDLAAATVPDFLQDAREPFPFGFKAILIDPPYSAENASHYAPGAVAYPSPNLLLKNALCALDLGRRVGILHYIVPQPPRGMKTRFVAMIGVMVGFNNRIRAYSVFERVAESADMLTGLGAQGGENG